jgi:hypothetical protein
MFYIRSIRTPYQQEPQSALHYCWVVDISGSMYGEIAQLREDLKNKLATQLLPGQFVTIIYYSSNGLCGYVLDGFHLQDASSITTATKAIYAWLRPMSMTGFVEPLGLAYDSIIRFKQQQVDTILVFMTDGYENQNPESEVLNACKRVGVHALACYVVEYGDYANHNLLEKMADAMFGQLMFAGQLPDYNLILDSVLGTKSMVRYTVYPTDDDVAVFVQMQNGFIQAWQIDPINPFTPFEIVIDDASEVHVLSTNPFHGDATMQELVAGLIALFQLGLVTHSYDCIAQLGDVDIINKYFGAIGKQRRNQFIDFLRARLVNPELLFIQPRNISYTPHPADPDFFDLLEVLSSEPGNRFLCRHHLFKYRRGSAVVESKNEETLKFEEYKDQSIDFQSIVLNTSRANVSFRGCFKGSVDVTNHSGNPDKARLTIIPTHIYRTYNIVRDGVFVMDKIPVALTPTTLGALHMLDFYPEEVEPGVWLIDLQSMPIANMQRTSDAADGLVVCDKVYACKVLQAWQKVFRYYQSQLDTKKPSTEWLDKYGITGVAWLNENGIHESNGFHPVNTKGVRTDFYYAPVIDMKVTGFNSLPSVADVLKRIEANKPLSGGVAAMAQAIKAYQALVLKPESHLRLNAAVEGIVNVKREYEKELAGLVFTSLLSRQAFRGFVDDELTAQCQFEETFTIFNDKFTISSPAEEITFKVVESEEEISI